MYYPAEVQYLERIMSGIERKVSTLRAVGELTSNKITAMRLTKYLTTLALLFTLEMGHAQIILGNHATMISLLPPKQQGAVLIVTGSLLFIVGVGLASQPNKPNDLLNMRKLGVPCMILGGAEIGLGIALRQSKVKKRVRRVR